ncbi:MAG TPA: ROK family protein, partial [Abditibacteriaceae bacterium]
MSFPIYGIDLGGTTFNVGTVDEAGTVSHQSERPTRGEDGPDVLIPRLCDGVRGVQQNLRENAAFLDEEVSGSGAVGIGVPGVVRHKDGICVYAPNLPGWTDLPVTHLLSESLGLPTFIINDANAAALAEARFGA